MRWCSTFARLGRLPNLNERREPQAEPVKEGDPVSGASTGAEAFTGEVGEQTEKRVRQEKRGGEARAVPPATGGTFTCSRSGDGSSSFPVFQSPEPLRALGNVCGGEDDARSRGERLTEKR